MTTLQEPIGSGFGAASTTVEVVAGIDLRNKTAIVTGGYAGLGLETTRTLASVGAKVIVPYRDRQKAVSALKGIKGVELEAMDLTDPASIDIFAAKFLASGRPLDILVNNAGIMACPLRRDARGYETQFATNHLGHFQLVMRLWPALRQANAARVVSVSSWGHRYSPVLFYDPNYERRQYNRLAAYGQSKTANILFALELDKRGQSEGIRAFSVHPGLIVSTDLNREFSKEELRRAGVIGENGETVLDPSRNLKTVEQGAATQVWCATSSQLDGRGGVYCENCDVARPVSAKDVREWELGDSTRTNGVMRYAIDPESAARLWNLSEQLLRVKPQASALSR